MTKLKNTICLVICLSMLCFTLSVHVLGATGDIIGAAVSTDIVAYLNGCDIRSFNVGGYTMIVAEDLSGFGFNVVWDSINRRLDISSRPAGDNITTVTYYPHQNHDSIGMKLFNVYETDIVTRLDGAFVESYNIGGQTVISFESLGRYDPLGCNYDDGERSLYVNVPWYGATKYPSGIEEQENAFSGIYASYCEEVVRLCNIEREKYGLAPLKSGNQNLDFACSIRAKELGTLFSHTRPDGTKCFTALSEAGVRYMMSGENIAMGYADPVSVVNGWMNSEGHRANILNPGFTHIGVGVSRINDTMYWVQMFIAE